MNQIINLYFKGLRRDTNHVHDLYQTEGEEDGERLRVVAHWTLHPVVVLQQVLQQVSLMGTLQWHWRGGKIIKSRSSHGKTNHLKQNLCSVVFHSQMRLWDESSGRDGCLETEEMMLLIRSEDLSLRNFPIIKYTQKNESQKKSSRAKRAKLEV